ncbi:PREDICTED: speriolin [Elephantulus edwardii]|uniref:speriolin n=1 Tax=Elephantulus edwardii TaxID=28737 RepID=UPI0003F0A672|nr:PREDICTED: speriolin [Elephantulus edwardii]
MSLLTNYEGLRHQIEKLVRENEELKKLAHLIRENHDLKSAIKTQAGGLAISSFSSWLGEGASHQGVFLPSSPAAANQPGPEDMGVGTLTDMLNNSQPGPPVGSIVSNLPGQLNALLSSSGPVSQDNQYVTLLAAPGAVPPTSTITSSLGLPATGPLSGHLTSTMAVPPASTLTTSLGLTSTSPMTPTSPMAVPPMGTVTTSLGLTSTGPLTPSSPMMVPPVGTIPLTPNSPLAVPSTNPLTGPPNLLASPAGNTVLSESTRVRLSEPSRRPSTGPQPSVSSGSATHTKAGEARGPRSETSRKSILELERKLAHRRASKFSDSPRECKQLAWERLVGEIAFQLDRRILSSIFPERVRLYGFTVANIPEKIIQASMNPNDHKLDEDLCQTLTQRYVSIMNRLQSLGYNGHIHPALTEQLVNAYGILRERPELAASDGGCYTMDFLQRVLVETVHPNMLSDALLLLSCLSQLAHDDGKPMFIW